MGSEFPEWVYIAGPYTHPEPCGNTHRMCLVWDELTTMFPDVVFVCPLWSHFQNTVKPRPYQDWLQYDRNVIDLLSKSGPGAVLRLDGDSSGADEEVSLALSLGVPVIFGGVDDFRSEYGYD